ncbi:c-type cytochrome [Paracoccus sp. M683]|uniref:di-heme oxidoreductase family protein n=1 Tax=Paracoccus sp. M683 TaxID=2594268 RepID=UPI00117DF8BD|nr:di-heme oxidoredictase family protein [Paracoccus sp. M683]TRW98450.1 c-type cytochrome [Paracoccus sp. M683]
MAATSAGADPLADDPHLNTVPRSPAEAARISTVTAPTSDFSAPEPFEANPGGAATVRAMATADAFSQFSANLSFEDELRFKLGNALFRKLWVSSPSSTLASDGLGPLYNARGCQSCHLKDGRGQPPMDPEQTGALSMLMRLSVPVAPDAPVSALSAYLAGRDGAPVAATMPDPVYGNQLQPLATPGQTPEGRLAVTWTEEPFAFPDGEQASLLRPDWRIDSPHYGPFADGIMISPRIAPQMIGLGLIEAIPAADILAGEDPDDTDRDGISGRAAVVISPEFQRPVLGRFGLKAGAATIREQSAAAFSGDIGISTPLVPAPWGECSAAQADCRNGPHGDGDARGTEIDEEGLDLVTFYSRNLAVPARRDLDDPQVLAGKQQFYQAGCTACHRPKFVTHRLSDRAEQSFQLIWPYSDFLLHDMGEGLADNRPDGRATGQEWRTPPLWGIGLTGQVSGHTRFLHDGRARNLTEAVLWHGGEAQTARDHFVSLSPQDRAALIRFLESL